MSRGKLERRKEDARLHPLNEDDHHDDHLHTAEVEDDYGALNDKTSYEGLDFSGLDVHDNVGELEHGAEHPLDSSSPAINLDDEDSLNFEDIVQLSVSHLGLDDGNDDDPAIMTYYKATTSAWPFNWGRPRSPPPPVIIQQRFDGSPLMETIWTPKPAPPFTPNDQLRSLLWKLQNHQQHQQSQEHGSVDHQAPGSPSLPVNARTLDDVEREMLNCASNHPMLTGSPPPESPSGFGENQAERLSSDFGNSVSSHPMPIGSSCPESPSGSGETQAERLEGGDFGNSFSSHPMPTGSLYWKVILPPYSHISVNAPAIHAPMPLQSSLSGFQLGMNQLRFDTLNSGSSHDYQQHAYETVFGNQGGAKFGSPAWAGGVLQQQILNPYPRNQFLGNLNPRGGSNGSVPESGNVVAVSKGQTIVARSS